jgi:hypothetical protein
MPPNGLYLFGLHPVIVEICAHLFARWRPEIMFENLTVSRVTLHHIFRRSTSGARIDPVIGEEVFHPTGRVKSLLETRLVASLGNKTKSMSVDVVKGAAGSTFQLARGVVDSDDDLLILNSELIANQLADAQVTQTPNEGFLFIICGTVGPLSKRFVALMKAEPQEGFAVQDAAGITFSFLNNLVLTPASKLYKVGMFIEDDATASSSTTSSGWVAHLYDDNMSQANRENASIYFYEAFLGCALPKDNAFRTKRFFELTETFILALPETPEVKSDLKTALYTYLKVDTSTTVSVDDFADTYFASDTHRMGLYKTHMRTAEFQSFAFTKDLQDLALVLKKRTLRFPSGIKITGLAASIETLSFETETSEDASGRSYEQTIITVPEKLVTV